MQKRTVVLGGAGFIGSHLCLRLLDEGHEVFCVDMRDATNAPLLRGVMRHPAFRYVHHNIIHTFGIRCDEIYNLASPAMVRYDRALPVETLKSAMTGSINALDTARVERARILYASSGDASGNMPRSDVGSTGCTTRYILNEGKRAAEALHFAYREEYGVDARIARIYNTYGAGAEIMDQRVVMKMIVAALGNHDIVIHGSGMQRRTFCYVEDVVDGIIRLMTASPAKGVRTVELGGSEEIAIADLAERIIAITGSQSRIVRTKARPDDLMSHVPNITAARRELGWRPHTSLTEGLRRTIIYADRQLKEGRMAATWAEMN